jgi:hypothetical protein
VCIKVCFLLSLVVIKNSKHDIVILEAYQWTQKFVSNLNGTILSELAR